MNYPKLSSAELYLPYNRAITVYAISSGAADDPSDYSHHLGLAKVVAL